MSAIPLKIADYLAYAESHRRASESMVEAGRPWRLVINYYSSLHYLNAFISSQNYSDFPSNHRERGEVLKILLGAYGQDRPDVMKAYKRIKFISEEVRYSPMFRPQDSHYSSSETDWLLIKTFVEKALEATPIDETR